MNFQGQILDKKNGYLILEKYEIEALQQTISDRMIEKSVCPIARSWARGKRVLQTRRLQRDHNTTWFMWPIGSAANGWSRCIRRGYNIPARPCALHHQSFIAIATIAFAYAMNLVQAQCKFPQRGSTHLWSLFLFLFFFS